MLEHSKLYLMQAQVEYWRDMIERNRSRLTETTLRDMRGQLAQATHNLSHAKSARLQLSACAGRLA